MRQYCKYCANANKVDNDHFICRGDCSQGYYGWGKTHSKEKAERINRCRYFVLSRNIFNDKEYKPRKDTMYYRVYEDDLEQIEYIADTSGELAEMCGVKRAAILKAVERYEKGQSDSRYRRIVLMEE